MLSLTDDLVTEITINGVTYQLNMAFDNIIKINNIQNDMSLSDAEQLERGMRLLFVNPPPLSLQRLCDDFVEAYTQEISTPVEEDVEYDLLGNPMPKKPDDEEEDESSGAEYCFTQDAPYIYASFMMDYGINLHEQRGKMHWHVFKALVNGLSEETMFKKVLRIRQEPLPKDSKARNELEKLKKQYALKPRKAVQHEGS